MVSDTLKNNFQKLKIVSSLKSDKTRKQLLKELQNDPAVFRCISEISKNIILGNVPLKRQLKKKLLKQKKLILRTAVKPKGRHIRRKLVVQSGGFLQLIIPALTGIVTDLVLSSITKKK